MRAGGQHTIHDVSMRATKDSARRCIAYTPCAGRQFDVREAAAGCAREGGWLGGMFDRGSWREYQEGWARTVVTGRARLEGLPVGVLGVESNTVTVSVPADPGMPTSSEQEIVQAGQARTLTIVIAVLALSVALLCWVYEVYLQALSGQRCLQMEPVHHYPKTNKVQH